MKTRTLLSIIYGFLLCSTSTFGQATVESTTNVLYGTDNVLRLINSQAGRTIGVTTNWSKIRIGMRFLFRPFILTLSSTPRFAVGMCSGTNAMYLDLSCSNFVGIVTTNDTWTYNANFKQLTTGEGALCAVKKVSTNTTIGNTLSSVIRITADTNSAPYSEWNSVLYVDITKGSPSYKVQAFYHNNSTIQTYTNINHTSFINDVVLTPPVLTGYALSSEVSIATDESAGPFDTVNISWDRDTAALEILDLAIVKLL